MYAKKKPISNRDSIIPSTCFSRIRSASFPFHFSSFLDHPPSLVSPLSPLHCSPVKQQSNLSFPKLSPTLSSGHDDLAIVNIVLPSGRKFRLSSSIFSDESDSEGSPTNEKPTQISRPKSTSGRVREKSERKSKKSEDKQRCECPSSKVSSKAETEGGVSWDWSWPIFTPTETEFPKDPGPRIDPSSAKTQAILVNHMSSSSSAIPPSRLCSDDEASSSQQSDCLEQQETCQLCSSTGKVWSRVRSLKNISEEEDDLLQCKECQLFTHLSCYGILPDSSRHRFLENFVCDSCEELRNRKRNGWTQLTLKCQLCFRKTGMMRTALCPQTRLSSHSKSDDQRWVHPLCVLYTPELTLNPDRQMKPNDISILDPDRKELVCEVCHKSGGSNVQCAHDDCYLSFHPYCGFLTHKQMIIRSVVAGASSESQADEVSEEYQFHYEVYCEKHKRRIRNLENIVSSTVEVTKPTSAVSPNRGFHSRQRRSDDSNSVVTGTKNTPCPPPPPPLDASWMSDEKKPKKRRRCVSLPPSLTPLISLDFAEPHLR